MTTKTLYIYADKEKMKVVSLNGDNIIATDKHGWPQQIPLSRVVRFCDENELHITYEINPAAIFNIGDMVCGPHIPSIPGVAGGIVWKITEEAIHVREKADGEMKFAKFHYKPSHHTQSPVTSLRLLKTVWQVRAELAENYINESPCDPDIYPAQLRAWEDWQIFLKLVGKDEPF